jgi:uncharacterized cofD-like protein
MLTQPAASLRISTSRALADDLLFVSPQPLKTDRMRNIVTIGGGSGQFNLLSGLRSLSDVTITAIVSMVDSGGSTGRLRDELDALPPGDILKCLVALSDQPDQAAAYFLKRFEKSPRLRGHNAGNLLLTMLAGYTGRFEEGIDAIGEILNVRGRVLPVTTDRATLVAELSDGSRVFGETSIDQPEGGPREAIRDLYLVPHHRNAIAAHPPAVSAIDQADVIVLGPGDLYTSLFPNLMVTGLREAVASSGALLVFPVNIMTKPGETDGFNARDFVRRLDSCIGRTLDVVLYNSQRPDAATLRRYQGARAAFVGIDREDPFWQERRLVVAPLLDTAGDVARHHPGKLAAAIDAVSR